MGTVDAPEIVGVPQWMYRVLNIASVAIIAKTLHNYFVFNNVHSRGTSSIFTGSNMEPFLKLLTKLKKNSILDAVWVLDPLLHKIYFTYERNTLLFSLWAIFVLEPRSALQSLKIKDFGKMWTKILWKQGYFLNLHKNLDQRVIFRILLWGKSGTPENFYCSEIATHVSLRQP